MVGLCEAMAALGERLEAALQARGPRRAKPHIVLGGPDERDQAVPRSRDSRVLLTLVGLGPDMAQRNLPSRRGAAAAAPAPAPPAALDAHLLVTADYPGKYQDGLDMMEAVLDWLHANPVVTGGQVKGAAEGPATFSLELVALSFEQAAAVVGMAGVKGMPFALYRLRGIRVGGGGG